MNEDNNIKQVSKKVEHNLEEGIVTTDGVYVKWETNVRWVCKNEEYGWHYLGDDYECTVDPRHKRLLKQNYRIFSTADAAKKWVEEANKPVTVEPIGWKVGDYIKKVFGTEHHEITANSKHYLVDTTPYATEDVNRNIKDGTWIIVKQPKSDKLSAVECIKLLIEANQVSKEELYPETVVETELPVLLTTEDGVDIRNPNNQVYGLYTDNWRTEDVINYIDNGKTGTSCEDWLVFSTPEARESYIVMNKPMLSLQDIKNWELSPEYGDGKGLEKLTELVKSKISQC